MITEAAKSKIINIWENYLKTEELSKNDNELTNFEFDQKRIDAIVEIKNLIDDFLIGKLNIYEFKTSLDSYNKRNNLWGFTAIKGQMFFNQLVKSSEQNIDKLASILKETIVEPINLDDAILKIEKLEKFTQNITSNVKDKRKAPKSSSSAYFLSYFWQIFNNEKWPIIYTSLTDIFTEIGIWKPTNTQKEDYKTFYNVNEEIKKILGNHFSQNISNWDAEHSFWNFKEKNVITEIKVQKKENTETIFPEDEIVKIKAHFEISDYLIPRVAKLVELGNDNEKSSSAKGSQYEKLVSEIFKQLDFEVEVLGQGSGRNPDAIIKCREDNTAFLVDAKAYSNGYNLGLDDRAIKEYINFYCPKLQKEGYKKIGFIIVSNSFKSNFDSFINEITWNTDIKRFILLTSEALLYLLAYKTKDRLNLSNIIESIVSFGNLVEAQNIIEEFDDI